MLLGGFHIEVKGGSTPPAPAAGSSETSRRLVALLALHDHPLSRSAVAGSLWPDVPEDQALGRLRSALSRRDPVARAVTRVTPLELGLAPDVTVDWRDARGLARTVLHDDQLGDVSSADAVCALSLDLLPGWDEPWVLEDAREWRELRIHALEVLAHRLTDDQCWGDAAEAALSAIRADPLRESARTTLIRLHLLEGNRAAAIEEYRRYHELLADEVGLVPTDELTELTFHSQLGHPE